MDSISDFRISALVNTDDNNKCFDCQAEKPMWASITNGVFICSICSIEHKKMMTNLSKLKSLTLDEFDDEQIKFLRLGGNRRLQIFLAHYGVSSQLDIQTKYSMVCTEYYRCMLLLDVNGRNTEYLERPNQITGLNLIQPRIASDPNLNSNTPQGPEEPKKGFFSKVSNFFDKTGKEIKEKITDLKIDEKAKSGWNWTESIVIKTGNAINEKSKEVIVIQ